MSAVELDQFDVRVVRSCPGPLREFNSAGVLAPADVHVATRLASLGGESSSDVMLAAALAVRAPRLGHMYVDLRNIRETAAVDAEEPVELSALPWPSPRPWLEAVAASKLVAVGEGEVGVYPFRLIGPWLYLDRYWAEERQVAADLRAKSALPAAGVDVDVLFQGLARLYADARGGRQAMAAASAVLRRLAVLAGGPGTGKTTTVARILALLAEQAARPPLVALAAPTGKAAARLEEAVHEEALRLPVAGGTRDWILGLGASTLHRLLGRRAGSYSRFRHNRDQRLPHDVVIVDETSMVSLSLMARLIEAIRPDARLVLVGDPGQLVSIEAGAVLGDIVGPAFERLMIAPAARAQLARATGAPVDAGDPPPRVSIGDGIIVLDRVHRFGGGIAQLASAVRRGDVQAVLELLADPPDDVEWLCVDVAAADALDAVSVVRSASVAAARTVFEASAGGDARSALDALARFRLLCAHRRGPYGVSTWTARIEDWLAAERSTLGTDDPWYVGRPLLVTENDYELRLYNGDTGVIVEASDGRLSAAFERGGTIVEYSPSRLSGIDTVYAMTIHKSQGSQFDTAAVLLPDPSSRILSRELLYTAVTRARERLVVVGTEDAVWAAVGRAVARASGLRGRLWDR